MINSFMNILRDGLEDILIKEDDFPSGTFDWGEASGRILTPIRSYNLRILSLKMTVDYKIGVKLDNITFDVLNEDVRRFIMVILYNVCLNMRRIKVVEYVNE
ncbi:hypothetical protein [Proteus mirabilis]|uniref:hypothetical protein n=1 Tax=Proteus mirabilis TaxID=584 RepID=UPI0034D553E1